MPTIISNQCGWSEDYIYSSIYDTLVIIKEIYVANDPIGRCRIFIDLILGFL